MKYFVRKKFYNIKLQTMSYNMTNYLQLKYVPVVRLLESTTKTTLLQHIKINYNDKNNNVDANIKSSFFYAALEEIL